MTIAMEVCLPARVFPLSISIPSPAENSLISPSPSPSPTTYLLPLPSPLSTPPNHHLIASQPPSTLSRSSSFAPGSHRRSHPNLQHLSLVPLTPKYPIDPADYSAYFD